MRGYVALSAGQGPLSNSQKSIDREILDDFARGQEPLATSHIAITPKATGGALKGILLGGRTGVIWISGSWCYAGGENHFPRSG